MAFRRRQSSQKVRELQTQPISQKRELGFMQVFDWNTSEAQPVTELYRRMVAQGENISLARLEVAKGSRTRAHHHRHEELIILLQGKWQFQFPTGEVTLGPNQILKIPPGVEHSSEVLEDAVAI